MHDSAIGLDGPLGDLIVVLEVDDDDFGVAGALRVLLPDTDITIGFKCLQKIRQISWYIRDSTYARIKAYGCGLYGQVSECRQQSEIVLLDKTYYDIFLCQLWSKSAMSSNVSRLYLKRT